MIFKNIILSYTAYVSEWLETWLKRLETWLKRLETWPTGNRLETWPKRLETRLDSKDLRRDLRLDLKDLRLDLRLEKNDLVTTLVHSFHLYWFNYFLILCYLLYIYFFLVTFKAVPHFLYCITTKFNWQVYSKIGKPIIKYLTNNYRLVKISRTKIMSIAYCTHEHMLTNMLLTKLKMNVSIALLLRF